MRCRFSALIGLPGGRFSSVGGCDLGERELSLGVWRDSTLKIYVIRIVHKLLLELIYLHYTTRKPVGRLITMLICIRMDL